MQSGSHPICESCRFSIQNEGLDKGLCQIDILGTNFTKLIKATHACLKSDSIHCCQFHNF